MAMQQLNLTDRGAVLINNYVVILFKTYNTIFHSII